MGRARIFLPLFLLCFSPFPAGPPGLSAQGGNSSVSLPPLPPEWKALGKAEERKAREKLRSLGFLVLGEGKTSMEEFYTTPGYTTKFITTDMAWELAQRYVSLFFYWKSLFQAETLEIFSRRLLDHIRFRRGDFPGGLLPLFALPLHSLDPGCLGRLTGGDRKKVLGVLARLKEGKPFTLPLFLVEVKPRFFVFHWIFAADPRLAGYSRAVTWYHLLSLDLRKEWGRRTALALVKTIFTDPVLRACFLETDGAWRDLLGPSADLGAGLLARRLERIFGKGWARKPLGELLKKGRNAFEETLPLFREAGFEFPPSSFQVFPSSWPPDTFRLVLDCGSFFPGRKFPSGLDLVALGPLVSETGKRLFARKFSRTPWVNRLLEREPLPAGHNFYGMNLECLAGLLEPCGKAPSLFSSPPWKAKMVWTQLGGLALLREDSRPGGRRVEPGGASRGKKGRAPLLSPYPAFYLGLCRVFSRMARLLSEWEAWVPPGETPVEARERKIRNEGMERTRRAFRSMALLWARLSVLAEAEWSPLGLSPREEAFLRRFPARAYGLFRSILPGALKDFWNGPANFTFPAYYGDPQLGSFYFGLSRPHPLYLLLRRKGKLLLYKGMVLGYREGPGPFDLFNPGTDRVPLAYPRFTGVFRAGTGPGRKGRASHGPKAKGRTGKRRRP